MQKLREQYLVDILEALTELSCMLVYRAQSVVKLIN